MADYFELEFLSPDFDTQYVGLLAQAQLQIQKTNPKLIVQIKAIEENILHLFTDPNTTVIENDGEYIIQSQKALGEYLEMMYNILESNLLKDSDEEFKEAVLNKFDYNGRLIVDFMAYLVQLMLQREEGGYSRVVLSRLFNELFPATLGLVGGMSGLFLEGFFQQPVTLGSVFFFEIVHLAEGVLRTYIERTKYSPTSAEEYTALFEQISGMTETEIINEIRSLVNILQTRNQTLNPLQQVQLEEYINQLLLDCPPFLINLIQERVSKLVSVDFQRQIPTIDLTANQYYYLRKSLADIFLAAVTSSYLAHHSELLVNLAIAIALIMLLFVTPRFLNSR